MTITVRPASAFEDVRTLVGPKSPGANVCWCLSYRVPSKLNNELRGPERGAYVAELCRAEPPPGVLAYDGDEPVGWAAVAPRSDTSFARSRRIPHVDEVPVSSEPSGAATSSPRPRTAGPTRAPACWRARGGRRCARTSWRA
ncbi:hypothetical protein SCMC78_05110 [Streptomyces sp. CMC78]|uniref:GNAT family N-acetyltransferase n=1 Tax=Streptomyces sp. CMC78 TaxID=3231512 RepID=A0AB33K550_9ACTN